MKNSYLFAVIEDDDAEAEALNALFRAYAQEHNIIIRVKRFQSAIALLIAYRSEYDALFFDVDLPGMDGIEASRKLRKIDPTVPLVFVTALTRYTLKGYEVNAINYLLKPVQKADAFLTFDTIIRMLSINENESIIIHTLDGYARVIVNSILYVEVSSHKVVYHTMAGNFDVRSSMKQTMERLDSRRFVLCNSGTLVNLSHVEFIDKEGVVIKGEKLLFSRAKKKGFVEKMNVFLSNN